MTNPTKSHKFATYGGPWIQFTTKSRETIVTLITSVRLLRGGAPGKERLQVSLEWTYFFDVSEEVFEALRSRMNPEVIGENHAPR